MHGAPHGIIDDEAVCEFGMVMRARGPNCKVLLAAPNQERFFSTHASSDDGPVREPFSGDAVGKIQVIRLLHSDTPVMGIRAAAIYANVPNQNGILTRLSVVPYCTSPGRLLAGESTWVPCSPMCPGTPILNQLN